MNWKWHRFSELSGEEMHDLLSARQEVFIVEQNCPYLDADALDKTAWHLIGRRKEGEIAAYVRLNPPGTRYKEPSIGRVLTRQSDRERGLARKAVAMAISKCSEAFPQMAIRISAQTYLTRFYAKFGFEVSGKPYDEDGIEHVVMVKAGVV